MVPVCRPYQCYLERIPAHHLLQKMKIFTIDYGTLGQKTTNFHALSTQLIIFSGSAYIRAPSHGGAGQQTVDAGVFGAQCDESVQT